MITLKFLNDKISNEILKFQWLENTKSALYEVNHVVLE